MRYKKLGGCTVSRSDRGSNTPFNRLELILGDSEVKNFIRIETSGGIYEMSAKDAWWLARLLDQAVKEATKETLAPTKVK